MKTYKFDKGIIFVSGVYGVGKSTLCEKLSNELNIPSFSAGDLISEINGEIYGKNKVVTDKDGNQRILIEAINHKLTQFSSFFLAGHFCIFDKNCNVELLPNFVYKDIPIKIMLLLEADRQKILSNINKRDNKSYPTESVDKLIRTEKLQAENISSELNIPLIKHRMNFDENDTTTIIDLLLGSEI